MRRHGPGSTEVAYREQPVRCKGRRCFGERPFECVNNVDLVESPMAADRADGTNPPLICPSSDRLRLDAEQLCDLAGREKLRNRKLGHNRPSTTISEVANGVP